MRRGLRSLAPLARYALPCGLCYARPLAYCSLLACCLRAPMRSRFARFVAALRSRSVHICSAAPLRLVGVALIAGAPAPLTGLTPYVGISRRRAPAPSRALPSLRSGETGAMRPRPPLCCGRRYAKRQRGSSAIAGSSRCSCPNAPRCRQPSPAVDSTKRLESSATLSEAHWRYAPKLKIANTR